MLEYLESQVFSKIKYGIPDNVKQKYPDLEFSTSDYSTDNASFPYVYVHLLGSQEISKDLERNTLNGISATFQVEISDNINQVRARTIMNEVVKIMKRMMFDIPMAPNMSNYNKVFRCIARFSRNIDYNDVL